jgi:hypothetical protein
VQRRHLSLPLTLALVLIGAGTTGAAADSPALQQALAKLQQLGKEGQGHAASIEAWQTIAAAEPTQLPAILASMQDDNPLANNWVRAAVDAIAERTLQHGGQLPVAALDEYLATDSHSPRCRRLAFEWLTKVDSTAHARWIPRLLDDNSLELRREAIADQLAKGQAAEAAGQQDEAAGFYRTALDHGRDLDQIDAATAALRKLGHTVDLPRHFGFVMKWHLIGPFDNTDTSGFDRAYPPEEEINLQAEYPGKDQAVRWQEAATEDEYGKVDLNKLLGKHKGAAAYAVATFMADDDRPVDLRLGCLNANKIWLNGQLLTANHVYHSGDGIDQYVGRGQLRAGANTILLKICQNEQTEEWAQDWSFQLRVCDWLGTAILSADR